MRGTIKILMMALAVVAACSSTGWATQDPYAACPAATAPPQIEVLPAVPFKGNTCPFTRNNVTRYGTNCEINGFTYGKPDVLYKVWLHAGNNVEFKLRMSPPANLALALIGTCGVGDSCVKSSKDLFGSVEEVISARNYVPGIYFLFVDANDFNGACGPYELTVAGLNPTPDLVVGLTGLPKPVATAAILTYTVSVMNGGDLAATGVKATLSLPRGVSLLSASAGCTNSVAGIVCAIGSLGIGARAERKIQVRVNLSPGSTLISTAEAQANEGDRTPLNNKQRDDTNVSR